MKLRRQRRIKNKYVSGEWRVASVCVNTFTRTLACSLLIIFFLLVACTAPAPSSQSILYLDYDADGVVQLYQTDVNAIPPTKLTNSDRDILHVAISNDGAMAAYATADAIWLMDVDGGSKTAVYDCLEVECNRLVWHPDGRRLLYERVENGRFPQLFWLDTVTGDTAPLLETENQISQSAAFSPDGKWIAYIGSPDVGMQLFNLETGELRTVRTEISTAPVWSADSQTLYFRDRDVEVLHEDEGAGDDHTSHDHSYVESVYLFSYTLGSEEIVQLTDGIVDDGRPVLSPDGESIAFGRKPPRTNAGREIWLMGNDGSNLRQLTPTDPTSNYGGLGWGENGRFLVLQQYQIDTPAVPASLWLLDVETGDRSPLQPTGFLPIFVMN